MHHLSDPGQLSPCVCTALRKASRAVTRVYDEEMEGAAMSVAQFSILRHLARHGDLPLSRLAESLVMDRTTLYRALGPIGRHGWVTIAAGNGRARVAALSDVGRQAMADAAPGWERAQTVLLERFGADEWREMERALGRVVSAAEGGAA
jgi:DNA-binding MarR family transcriptional regulator